jgi:hypothetical protein
VRSLTKLTGSQRQALELSGVSRSTWHYRQNPRERVRDPLGQSERAYQSRISTRDRDRISEYIMEGWADQVSVDHSFAAAWDAGVMLASRRTWWRIAAQIEDQMLRPTIPTRTGNKRLPREKPVVMATGPGQVWSWDITDLYSPWRGKTFKAYSVLDIYSRKMVAWRVEEREADHLAVDMFEPPSPVTAPPTPSTLTLARRCDQACSVMPSPPTACSSHTTGPTYRTTTPSVSPGSGP